MKTDYRCLACERSFSIDVTDDEAASSLDPARTDRCPYCAQRVGIGPVHCRECGQTFELAFPHSHVQCNLSNGSCPACNARFVSACIC